MSENMYGETTCAKCAKPILKVATKDGKRMTLERNSECYALGPMMKDGLGIEFWEVARAPIAHTVHVCGTDAGKVG